MRSGFSWTFGYIWGTCCHPESCLDSGCVAHWLSHMIVFQESVDKQFSEWENICGHSEVSLWSHHDLWLSCRSPVSFPAKKPWQPRVAQKPPRQSVGRRHFLPQHVTKYSVKKCVEMVPVWHFLNISWEFLRYILWILVDVLSWFASTKKGQCGYSPGPVHAGHVKRLRRRVRVGNRWHWQLVQPRSGLAGRDLRCRIHSERQVEAAGGLPFDRPHWYLGTEPVHVNLVPTEGEDQKVKKKVNMERFEWFSIIFSGRQKTISLKIVWGYVIESLSD